MKKKEAMKIMKAFADFPAKVTGQTSRCKSSRLLEQSAWIEIIIFEKDFDNIINWWDFYFSNRRNYCIANLWRWKFSAIFRILGVGPKGCCADVILSSIQRVEQCSDWISISPVSEGCYFPLLQSKYGVFSIL